jgi:hypothetical protein
LGSRVNVLASRPNLCALISAARLPNKAHLQSKKKMRLRVDIIQAYYYSRQVDAVKMCWHIVEKAEDMKIQAPS